MAEDKKSKKDKKLFELGPMEQILVVLGIMAFGAHPSMPWSMAGGTLTSIPLFSPASLMLVFIAYFGFHLLKRQEGERDRQKALAKAKAKSSSSSSSSSSADPRSRSAMTSEQMRARGGMPSSSMTPRTGDPSPKQVSKSSRSNPASNTFKGNYFMTMQGPGRPALVPFQSGLRPKEGEEAGTMWWDNVPEDAKELMAPAVNEDTARKMNKMTNPWALDALTKDVALFRLEKERREEEARFEKVGNILQTLLGLLLCLVDMRLGLVAIIFFLWRHYTIQHERESDTVLEDRAKEIKELKLKMRECQQTGASRNDTGLLEQQLRALIG